MGYSKYCIASLVRGLGFLFPLFFLFILPLFAYSEVISGLAPLDSWSYLVSDPYRDLVYAADVRAGKLAVISSQSGGFFEVDLAYPPLALALSKDGRYLALAAGEGGICFFEAGDLGISPRCSIPGGGFVSDLTFDYGGNIFFVDGREQGEIGKFSPSTRTFEPALFAKTDYYRPLIKSDDSGLAINVAESAIFPAALYRYEYDPSRAIWNSALDDTQGRIGANLRAYAVSLDGERLYLSCATPRYIQVFSPNFGVTALLDVESSPLAVAVSPGGGRVYGLSAGTRTLFEFAVGADRGGSIQRKALRTYELAGETKARGLAIERRGEFAFAIVDDRDIDVIELVD